MRKQMTALCLAAFLLMGLTACGSDSASESAVSASSTEESIQEESTIEDSAIAESALEDSTLEETVELTVDEQFAQFLSDASGVCLKLRACDRMGNPVKNGTVLITEKAEERSEASQTEPAGAEICNAETDSSGYAFLSQLELNRAYTLTVYDQEEAQVGTVTLEIESGDSYGGASDEDSILLTVADDSLSNVDLAIIATDDDGTISSFSLFRTAKWKEPTE